MADNKDKQIEQFFNSHKREIPDDGFTEKVIRHLPKSRQWWEDKIWTTVCFTAIVCWFVIGNCWSVLGNSLRIISRQMSSELTKYSSDPQFFICIFIAVVFLIYIYGKKIFYEEDY